MAAPSSGLDVPQGHYSRVAIALHWIVAAAVVWQASLGVWMIQLPDEGGVQAPWFNLHKSTGMVIFALVLLRLAWRIAHPPPPLPRGMPAWQRRAAQVVHRLMYLCLVVAPLAGFTGSHMTRYPVKFFGWTMPRLLPPSPAGKELMSAIHLGAVSLLLTLVLLHAAAALVHLWRRDGIAARMGLG